MLIFLLLIWGILSACQVSLYPSPAIIDKLLIANVTPQAIENETINYTYAFLKNNATVKNTSENWLMVNSTGIYQVIASGFLETLNASLSCYNETATYDRLTGIVALGYFDAVVQPFYENYRLPITLLLVAGFVYPLSGRKLGITLSVLSIILFLFAYYAISLVFLILGVFFLYMQV